eukprot:360763-Chlamydomonas_euryale.AAC.4
MALIARVVTTGRASAGMASSKNLGSRKPHRCSTTLTCACRLGWCGHAGFGLNNRMLGTMGYGTGATNAPRC